jgi:hypothetical protein
MDVFIHYGMAAGIQAMKDSGLEVTRRTPTRIGVNIGSGIGGLPMIEDTHNDFLGGGPRKISPFFIPGHHHQHDFGKPLDHVRTEGAESRRGDGVHYGLHAIGTSYRMIQYGDADAMVCGGAESTVTPLAIGGFASAQALSTRNDDPATASRPWDKGAMDSCLAKVRACWYLRSTSMRKAAAQRIYAEVAGFGMSGDAFHMTAPDTDGPRRSMVNALKDAQINGSGPVPQRPRYVDAAGRQERDGCHQAGVRRCRPQPGGEFHQVHDGSPAGRRRRSRVGTDGAGGAPSNFAADHQYLRSGSGVRSRLLCQHCASAQDRGCPEEQLRIRRHQRHAGFPWSRPSPCSRPICRYG